MRGCAWSRRFALVACVLASLQAGAASLHDSRPILDARKRGTSAQDAPDVDASRVEAPAPAGDAVDATVARTRGALLLFTGPITPEAVARVRGLLVASPQVRELVIESGGGDVEAGMDFGELVHARGLDVRVTGMGCASSCANYVFPAGRRKSIDPGSLVLWHGSMLQEGLVESFDVSQIEHPSGRPLTWRERRLMKRTVAADFQRLSARQARFYERLGVDATITIVGQQQGCACNWTLSVQDMARFGVRDVFLPDDYAGTGYGDQSLSWQLVRVEGAMGGG